jgi:hypothetical protein
VNSATRQATSAADLELISNHELAQLIRRSEKSGCFVPLRFGPGWAAIDPTSSGADWALEQLQLIRDNDAMEDRARG